MPSVPLTQYGPCRVSVVYSDTCAMVTVEVQDCGVVTHLVTVAVEDGRVRIERMDMKE